MVESSPQLPFRNTVLPLERYVIVFIGVEYRYRCGPQDSVAVRFWAYDVGLYRGVFLSLALAAYIQEELPVVLREKLIL